MKQKNSDIHHVQFVTGKIDMKKILFSFILMLLVFLTSFTALAHPGRTDSNGGHYDRSTGEYHFHHGYSAHLHPNGECPYDLNNNTYSSEIDWEAYMEQARKIDEEAYNKIKEDVQQKKQNQTNGSVTKKESNNYLKTYFGKFLIVFTVFVLCAALCFSITKSMTLKQKLKQRKDNEQ